MEDILKECIDKSYPGMGMRTVEYAWTFRNLIKPPARVLDVGGVTSYLTIALVKLGYEVYSIDIRSEDAGQHWEPWVHPDTKEAWRRKQGFRFIQEDIRKTTLPDNFFDQILCISTLEHIGLDAFGSGDIDLDNGDKVALQQMVRILKPGGSILMTFTYGVGDWRGRWQHRVYDDQRLDWLLHGLKILNMQFYTDKDGQNIFRPCSREEALAVNTNVLYAMRSLVFINLTK